MGNSIDKLVTDVASILTDTGTTLDAALAVVDTNVDAILVDTGTTLPATLTTIQEQTYNVVSKSITLGTGSVPVTENLFTVTGEVEAYVFGFVDTAVTSGGAMTLELGVTGNTAALIAITAVGELDVDEFWTTTTSAVGVQAPPAKKLISAANILHVIRDADCTAGAITYYCVWRPISSDGDVVAA